MPVLFRLAVVMFVVVLVLMAMVMCLGFCRGSSWIAQGARLDFFLPEGFRLLCQGWLKSGDEQACHGAQNCLGTRCHAINLHNLVIV